MELSGTGDLLLRLVVAAAAGVLVGFERERREKAAGLRTLTLVSTGSALFVLSALTFLPGEGVRMSAGIATGVGFLGAGAILRDRGEVLGLTTAATVWIAAALGIAAASGALLLTVVGTAASLLILTVLGMIDFSAMQQDARTYEVAYTGSSWSEAEASRYLAGTGLKVSLLSVSWSAEGVTAVWRAVGRRALHEALSASLVDAPGVSSFTVRA